MPSLEEFCTIEAELRMNVIGKTPGGMRIDFPFEGSATGPHWEGERPVSGVDYVTVRSDGNMALDIHAVIGEESPEVARRVVARLKDRRALRASGTLPALDGGFDVA